MTRATPPSRTVQPIWLPMTSLTGAEAGDGYAQVPGEDGLEVAEVLLPQGCVVEPEQPAQLEGLRQGEAGAGAGEHA